MVRTVQESIAARERGETFEFPFFRGHRKSASGETTKSCFSQWYEAAFEKDGVTYPTAEHFMMAKKAELFGDAEARDAILAATAPGKAKALGRKVKGFDEAT